MQQNVYLGKNALLFEEGPVAALLVAVLMAEGAPDLHASIVASHLVQSSRLGVHSHGIVRLPQYVNEIRAGELSPSASASEQQRDHARVVIDGRLAFGQVAAEFAVDCALEIVSVFGIAFVNVRRTGHTGRIGAYTERLARAGFVALAACSGSPVGHWVAPFGGRIGRMATNPISYAVPTIDGPIVADFATSAATEGEIRMLRDRGLEAAVGLLHDPIGTPTCDPKVLYDDPPGAIVPLGGESHGHKGFALGLLVEVLATLMAGDEADDVTRPQNSLALLAVAADDGLPVRAARLGAYVRSSPAIDPSRPVQMPGDREREYLRQSRGVLVDERAWRAIARLAAEHSIQIPTPLERVA